MPVKFEVENGRFFKTTEGKLTFVIDLAEIHRIQRHIDEAGTENLRVWLRKKIPPVLIRDPFRSSEDHWDMCLAGDTRANFMEALKSYWAGAKNSAG